MKLEDFSPSAEDIAGLIKLYFRELPCALCGDLFVKFVDAQSKYNNILFFFFFYN